MKLNHITSVAFALSFIALTAIVGCSKNESLPPELKLKRVLHQKEVSHLVGPGGQNHSFTVYELPKEVSAVVADKGLAYLNSLPSVAQQKKNFKPPRVETWSSPLHRCDVPGCPKCKDPKNIITNTATGPYWAPFVDWHATPVPKTAKWLRYEDERRFKKKGWEPSIASFYQSFEEDNKDAFISSISPEYADSFHTAISTPGSYYAYGNYRGMCLVVVSPKTGKAFYLFRD